MHTALKNRALLMLSCLSAAPVFATTYYVSPTGSDSNSGTNSASPWGSVAKVDSTGFKPGDQVLFQYGSTWNASLNATSSGTVGAPIVYGAYGNPKSGNPTFLGSDPVSASAFTQVTGTTYQMPTNNPVNWVYTSHNLSFEAQDQLAQAGSATDPASSLNYVESHPDSFYYNAGNGRLYVNMGGAPTNLTLGTRQDAIYSNQQSNLIFQNLNASETAADNGGYGIRIENSANVRLLNSTVTGTGKHAVGVIDAVGFTGTNLVANGSAPSQGFGGASAFVAYGDSNAAVPTGVNNTSKWTNIRYVNPYGPYPVFISHGGTNGVASVEINNIVSLNGYGTGIYLYTTSSAETAVINGGQLDGSAVEIGPDHSVVNGLVMTGVGGFPSITIDGQHTVVQNSFITGSGPNPQAYPFPTIADRGSNNTIRFNVVQLGAPLAGVGLYNPSGNTNIYGNIFQGPASSPGVGIGMFADGPYVERSNYNLFTPTTPFLAAPGFTYLSPQQWQAMGYDVNSAFGTPVYVDPANGNDALQNNSPGVGLYPGGSDPILGIANALLGSPQPNGSVNAGFNPALSNTANSFSGGVMLNNSQMTVVTPIGNTLTLQAASSLVVLGGSSLDIAGNTINNGSLVALGEFLHTGNFTNQGAVIIAGPQTWSPGTTFSNLSGYATIETDTGGTIAPAEYLAVNVSGGTVTFTSTQHLTSLTIGAAGKVQLVSLSGAARSILYTPSLSVTGILDLSASDLIIEDGNLPAINSLIRQGYNAAGGGHWDGGGITSTAAAADTTHLTALGVILNSVDGVTPLYNSGSTLGLFDGASPNPSDVLVRYTYVGDANLDGKVDGSDYSRIDNGYLLKLTGWYNGDFNYDGVVDGSDYTLIDNAFNQQRAILNAAITSEVASAAVPEPTAAALLAMVSPVLLRRRKVPPR